MGADQCFFFSQASYFGSKITPTWPTPTCYKIAWSPEEKTLVRTLWCPDWVSPNLAVSNEFFASKILLWSTCWLLALSHFSQIHLILWFFKNWRLIIHLPLYNTWTSLPTFSYTGFYHFQIVFRKPPTYVGCKPAHLEPISCHIFFLSDQVIALLLDLQLVILAMCW